MTEDTLSSHFSNQRYKLSLYIKLKFSFKYLKNRSDDLVDHAPKILNYTTIKLYVKGSSTHLTANITLEG